MSFKDKIDNIMESAVRSALEEATLKISHFTGKIADKAGFTMTKVGESNPGAVVVLKGDEKAIIGYARRYLGAEEGESLSQIQSDQQGGLDASPKSAKEPVFAKEQLEEANLKISHFTGKIADKAGFTMKKVGESNPGAVVVLSGDEKAIISYARRYLGAEEGQTLSQIQSDQQGGLDASPKSAKEPVFAKEDASDSDAEVDSDIQGKICQCCDNKITEDGCGCNEDCKHCGGMGKPVDEKGEHQSEAKLDPVGKADADIDNDGDVDSSDEYLKNRRKKIGSKIDATTLKKMAKAAAAKK
jgi:hypothetical protein